MELPLPPPLHPADFCRKWVPLIKGPHFGDYGYRKTASKFLAEVTGLTEKTCSTLLSESMEDLPNSLTSRLGAIDSIWEALQKNKNLRPLHPKDFCAKWTLQFYGKKPDEYGYGVASIKLLMKLTSYSHNYCRDMYYEQVETASVIQAYLGLIDFVWSLPFEEPSLEAIKNLFPKG